MSTPAIDTTQACLQAWQLQQVLRALYLALPEDNRDSPLCVKPIIDLAANLAGNLSLHLSEGHVALLSGEMP